VKLGPDTAAPVLVNQETLALLVIPDMMHDIVASEPFFTSWCTACTSESINVWIRKLDQWKFL
jgi:hypothetical protein